MPEKTIEETIKENQHKINILTIQREKLEKTFCDFKTKVDQLHERKNKLRIKAANGNHSDIKKYEDFMQQYLSFAEVVEQEGKKIEGAVQTLCEEGFGNNQQLKAIMQTLVLNKIRPGHDRTTETSKPGKFSANRL